MKKKSTYVAGLVWLRKMDFFSCKKLVKSVAKGVRAPARE
jgi:hypothetical protein